jgi:hypothetical protein
MAHADESGQGQASNSPRNIVKACRLRGLVFLARGQLAESESEFDRALGPGPSDRQPASALENAGRCRRSPDRPRVFGCRPQFIRRGAEHRGGRRRRFARRGPAPDIRHIPERVGHPATSPVEPSGAQREVRRRRRRSPALAAHRRKPLSARADQSRYAAGHGGPTPIHRLIRRLRPPGSRRRSWNAKHLVPGRQRDGCARQTRTEDAHAKTPGPGADFSGLGLVQSCCQSSVDRAGTQERRRQSLRCRQSIGSVRHRRVAGIARPGSPAPAARLR